MTSIKRISFVGEKNRVRGHRASVIAGKLDAYTYTHVPGSYRDQLDFFSVGVVTQTL